MLDRKDIHNIAEQFLLKNNFPIIIPGNVYMPEDEEDEEDKQDMLSKNQCLVSFDSNYPYDPSDPHQQLVPSKFIVFVNYETGEVYMPRPMA